jgi:hypothetical protein
MDDYGKPQVKKIVISSEDELTDIVGKITDNGAENILLVFGEPSDLLVSPVNLKVLQETADEAEKAMVFQIIDSPAGIRNVSEIGAAYTDSTDKIDDKIWERAYAGMKNRNKNKGDALKGIATAGVAAKAASEVVKDEDEIERPPQEDDGKEFVGEEIPTEEEVAEEMSETEVVTGEAPLPEEKSEFQERIDQALERSKHDIEASKNETVEKGGLKIAVDHDIVEDVGGAAAAGAAVSNAQDGSYNGPKGDNPLDLTGRDLMGKTVVPLEDEKGEQVVMSGAAASAYREKIGKLIPRRIPKRLKSKKLILFVLVPLLLIAALALFITYRYAPLVNVKMFIESRPVSTEETFVGDPTVTEFSLEANAVPIRKEEILKERSDSTNATGTATRGSKATGVVRFQCTDNGERVIPAGTTLTDEEGNVFNLVSEVSFDCPTVDFPTGTAEASDFGAEYNISSGVLFTVGVTGDPKVIGISETSFSGGSKEEYTVISQQDFDRVVNPLKENAITEAENELNKMATDGWVVVPGSMASALDGTVQSDYPVGAEADILNVTVKTKSSALYYKRSDLDAVMEELLLKAANDNNLFESEDDLDLSLSEEIDSEITIVSVEGDKVTIKLALSGEVKPTVDKNEIVDDLKGKSWDDGLSYLDKLTFVAQDTEVRFEPDWFPESLRYFPSRQGRILLKVVDVEVTPAEEASEEQAP